MAKPRILDRNGKELSRGAFVRVFPDTGRPDVSRVSHFTHDWLGWRVHHSWLTGYHPDEPNPSESTQPTDEADTYRCDDLELVEPTTKGAVNTGCPESERSS